MKNLELLSNTDKAKLLHQLFPAEIPKLVDFISGMCLSIKESEALNREAWDNGIITFEYWLQLLNQTEQAIKENEKAINKNARLFADLIFSGDQAAFVIHCIHVYITVQKINNSKFVLAVQMLFL